MSAAVVEPKVINLTAADRCDRDGAQAYHLAEKGEFKLFLCNHCEREHGGKMLEEGWTVTSDQSRPM